eukprot:SAG11_NODE_2536_length_3245_cov_3.417673_1_plen_74_part_00
MQPPSRMALLEAMTLRDLVALAPADSAGQAAYRERLATVVGGWVGWSAAIQSMLGLAGENRAAPLNEVAIVRS